MTAPDCPDDEAPEGYASPPCLMHELDPAYLGLAAEADPQQRRDVMRWRKATRERLLAARQAVDSETRHGRADRIATGLEAALGDVRGQVVSCYWPIRGEPDLRRWIARMLELGGVCALPVVIERGAPLAFHRWRPGERLRPGHWNIPVPAESYPVTPDIVIAPVVGFDLGCYRLGYGGGFFDRTLAALGGHARAIGVGYATARLPTIYPQWHDVPLDLIVTEEGICRREGS